MGVASLIAECLQLGVPVDFVKLKTESVELTADQVMELRLEQLLLDRKLEICTSEAQDFQKQLEQVSTENAYQKEEIKKLKAELQKMKKDSGVPGVRIKKERMTEERDDEDMETFDWAAAGVINSFPGNQDGTPQPNELPMDEKSARNLNKPRARDAGVMFNGSTSTFVKPQRDLNLFQLHSSVRSVSRIRYDYGKRSWHSTKSDDDVIPETQESATTEGRSKKGTILHSKSSAPAYLLPGRSSSGIFFPPKSQGHPKASGVSNVSIKRPRKSFSCFRCSKLFQSNANLSSHLFSVHSKDPGIFQCGPCRRGYFSKNELQRHVVRYHRGNPESSLLKCKYCSKTFNSTVSRFRHQKMHLGRIGEVVRATCEICEKSFDTFASLNQHKKTHE